MPLDAQKRRFLVAHLGEARVKQLEELLPEVQSTLMASGLGWKELLEPERDGRQPAIARGAKALGVREQDLAEELGLNQSSVSRLLNGGNDARLPAAVYRAARRAGAKESEILRVYSALNISLDPVHAYVADLMGAGAKATSFGELEQERSEQYDASDLDGFRDVAIGILDSDLDPEQKHKQFAEAAGELAARLFSRNTKESGTSPQFEEMRESLKQSRDPAAAYVLDIADGKLVR